MIVSDQHEVLAFLSTDAAYERHQGPVERIDTHGAIVFLAGDRAYKVKRAVRYDYMDFSTLDRRRAMCEHEVALNRRTAPDLYLGTTAVGRQPDGSLALGSTGPAVEWAVVMRRFDGDRLLDRMADRGELDESTIGAVADAVARLHDVAERRSDHGGTVGMRWVIDGNTASFREDGASALDPETIRRLDADSRAALDRHATLLDARRGSGFVRQGHGDLHLRNICMIDSRPTLFDAIEFNDEIACGDVLYDLAFLLMDLGHRDLRRLAAVALDRYQSLRADWDGLAPLPLFLSCRAAVRAKTSLAAAGLQPDPSRTRPLEDRARRYLAMAIDFLHPAPPRLIAIGGPSGTGKTTLARGLAPARDPFPGAIVLRSDVVRKRMLGVGETERLPDDAYAPDVNRRVYRRLADAAGRVTRAGHSVIVDAVLGDADDRATVAAVAREAGVPFDGIWLDAPAATLERRVARRSGDASDATVGVVREQIDRMRAPDEWARVDASGPREDVRRRAERTIARGDAD